MVRASIPTPAAGPTRPDFASPYVKLASSYLQRRSLWVPAAAFAAYLIVIAFGPGWSGDPGTGLGRATQALLANVGSIIYLFTASLSLGSHLREQLTNPRAPLMPGFASMHRGIAGAWLAGVILLPALLVWLLGASALANEGSSWQVSLLPILSGAVAVGLWTGYLLPWGLLLPLGAFVIYQALLATIPSPGGQTALALAGSAAAVALLARQRPRDGSSSSNSAQLTVNRDRIEMLNDLSGGLVPRLLLRFDKDRFQAPPVWIGNGFLARVLHRKRSLPVLRWETLAIAALPMGWLMAALIAADNLRLELAAANLRHGPAIGSDVIWPSGGSSIALKVGLAVIVVTIWREIATWMSAGQASKQLGYESLRSGPRARFVLEVGSAWYLHGLRSLLVAVILPSTGTLLYYGRAGQALEIAWWLVSADLLIYTASLYARLVIWKDGLVKGMLYSIVYLSVFLGSGAVLILSPEVPIFLSIAWLLIAVGGLGGLYRWLSRADLE